MEQTQLVILLGSTLLLSGLETCFRDLPDLRVTQLDAAAPEAMARLQTLQPDAIIFDRDDHNLSDWNAVARLLTENIRATVFGLDVNSDDLFVLYRQTGSTRRFDQIVAAIRARSNPNH
ncbi:MAG TPA: hypothetical protein VGK87_16430 [Anaerolineae bacterium]|jgi:hypothetical protein